MKKPNLEPYLPLGRPDLGKLWRNVTIYGNVLALLYSLSFWTRYSDAHAALYSRQGNLLPGAVMTPFSTLLAEDLSRFTMMGFCILVLFLLALIPVNYSAFYRGSKSIYVMRRLPNRWELGRRCAALPLLSAGGTLALMGLLTLLYYALYLLITPKVCLP